MTTPAVRILALMQTPLGDALFSLGALAALRRRCPEHRLVLVAHAPLAELFRYTDFADEVWDRPATLMLPPLWWYRRARRERFDLALVFTPSRRAVLLAATSGAPVRVGPVRSHFPWLVTKKMPERPVFSPQEAMDFVRLVEPEVEAGTYEGLIRLPEEELEAASQLLKGVGVDAGAPYVVMAPGVDDPNDVKRWPAERFATVARSLMESGLQVVLVGSEDECPAAVQIRQMAPGAADLTARTSLVRLAAVLQGAQLVIGNDSGPPHLGAAVGCRALVIFGPTNPELTGPRGERHVVMRNELPCAPCYRQPTCDRPECLLAIKPDAVAAAAMQLIGT